MSFSHQALAQSQLADPKLIDPAKEIYTAAHKVARATAAFLGDQTEDNFLAMQTAQREQNQAMTQLDNAMCKKLRAPRGTSPFPQIA